MTVANKEGLHLTFKLSADPMKEAQKIHRKMLKNGVEVAHVVVPNSDDTLDVPVGAPVEEIAKVIKAEQLKYKA